MKRSACLSVWLLVFLGVHATVPSVLGEDQRTAFKKDTHLFRNILHEAKVRPLQKLEDLTGSEDKKLLIVLGATDRLEKANFDLDRWVRKGGAALIATDRDTAIGGFLTPLGVRIRSNRVKVAEDSPSAYRRIDSCVVVKFTRRSRVIFPDLKQVATNRAGYIQEIPGEMPMVLANFPPDAFVEGLRLPLAIVRFAVGGPRGDGRILILSDHSVFINLMMIQDDNDNFDFAYHCVEWLTESGKRTEALFYDEGAIQTKFDIPIKVPPLPTPPPPEQVIAALNKGLAGIEEEDVINRALNEITGGTHVPLQALGLILTIAVAGLALSRLFQARHRFEPGVPYLASDVAQLVPSVEILEQRHRAILRQGNFWEVARLGARQAWDAILGAASGKVGRPVSELASEAAPAVPVRGSWWRRRKQQQVADKLWRLAYGAEPVWISARQWRRVEEAIRVLRATFAEENLQNSQILRQQASRATVNGSHPKTT